MGSITAISFTTNVMDPPIKIVATSGHVKIGAGDLPQGGWFLRKPYSPAGIMKTLRELIAA